METFNDLRNKMLEFYKIVNKDLLVTEENEYDSEEAEEDFENQELIIELIDDMDQEEKRNFLCLLILYYYSIINYIKEDSKDEEEDEEDEIIDLINSEDKDVVLECIEKNENNYLYDMISLLIEEDSTNYIYTEDKIDDYDYYMIIDDVLEDEDFKEIYMRYHPNIKKEEQEIKKYHYNEELLLNYSKIEISSLEDFIRVYSIAVKKFTSTSYLNTYLSNKLYDIKDKNKELYQEIYLFIIRYYYMSKYMTAKKDFNNYKYISYCAVAEINHPNYEIIDEFLSFDLIKMIYNYTQLHINEKKEMHEVISLERNKTYGEEGTLRKYAIEDKELILKYAPLWLSKIEEGINKYQILVYYSVDKDKEYKIPRFCLFINDKNKVCDILGREENLAIDFNILEVLGKEIEKFSNKDKIKKKITRLSFLKQIQDKIKNNEQLNRTEIDFLYEINYKKDEKPFGHPDYRHIKIRLEADEKKYLAQYFGCKEEEVATTLTELNENTVVTTIFNIYKETCNYPKLKVIFSDLNAPNLLSAKGLESLRYVKGNVLLNSLKSSKGLENLIRVDGDVNLESLDETTHFNDKLIIKGKAKFKNGDSPKQFKKK